MADTPWTPGPWHATDRGVGWSVHVGPAPRDCWSAVDGCRDIHEVGSWHEDTFGEANARLIAKAPEMAELLTDALEVLAASERDFYERACALLADIRGE